VTPRLTALVAALLLAGCTPRPGVPDLTVVPLPTTAADTTPTASTPVAAALPVEDDSSPVPGSGTCHVGMRNGQSVPDAACTPGAINPAVTQATIGGTICVSGWTKTVRPSTSVTSPMKAKLAAAYSVTVTAGHDELDHNIPIELGGALADPRNLWVEPGTIPNRKDPVENWLKRQVCSGAMTLAAAQAGIAADWTQYLPATTGTAPTNEES
jgi:hypothetical protein